MKINIAYLLSTRLAFNLASANYQSKNISVKGKNFLENFVISDEKNKKSHNNTIKNTTSNKFLDIILRPFFVNLLKKFTEVPDKFVLKMHTDCKLNL